MEKKNIPELLLLYAGEYNQLIKLLQKYNIKIFYPAIPFTPWKKTFANVLTQFKKEDYDKLLKSEAGSLQLVLETLKKISFLLKDYNRISVEEVFIENEIPESYYLTS